MIPQASSPKTPEALVEELRAIVAENVAGNINLLTRVGTLLGTVAREAPRMTARPADPSLVVSQGLDAMLASSAIVNTHAMAMMNELLTIVERSIVAHPVDRSSASPVPSPAPAELRLEGRIGELATAQFAVDNEYASPVQVSFTADALVGLAGPAFSATHVKLSPVRAVIPPNGSTDVRVSVDVTDEFVAGETYSTTIRVIGYQAPDVRVTLVVRGSKARRATASPTAAPAATTGSARRRRKRSAG